MKKSFISFFSTLVLSVLFFFSFNTSSVSASINESSFSTNPRLIATYTAHYYGRDPIPFEFYLDSCTAPIGFFVNDTDFKYYTMCSLTPFSFSGRNVDLSGSNLGSNYSGSSSSFNYNGVTYYYRQFAFSNSPTDISFYAPYITSSNSSDVLRPLIANVLNGVYDGFNYDDPPIDTDSLNAFEFGHLQNVTATWRDENYNGSIARQHGGIYVTFDTTLSDCSVLLQDGCDMAVSFSIKDKNGNYNYSTGSTEDYLIFKTDGSSAFHAKYSDIVSSNISHPTAGWDNYLAPNGNGTLYIPYDAFAQYLGFTGNILNQLGNNVTYCVQLKPFGYLPDGTPSWTDQTSHIECKRGAFGKTYYQVNNLDKDNNIMSSTNGTNQNVIDSTTNTIVKENTIDISPVDSSSLQSTLQSFIDSSQGFLSLFRTFMSWLPDWVIGFISVSIVIWAFMLIKKAIFG